MLGALEFVTDSGRAVICENVVILGPPGVGKTHLAVGLGLNAIEHGYRALFTTAANMIATLTKALAESKFEDKLKAGLIRTEESAAVN